MKRILMVGAGQMGRAAMRMINSRCCEIVGFADNAPELQGGSLDGIPIMSVVDGLEKKPDRVLIAVAGRSRTETLKEQIRSAGYTGALGSVFQYAEEFDIRSAVLKLLAERVRYVDGALAELGVYQGDFACQLNRIFPERDLYLFDTFDGFDQHDVVIETHESYSCATQGEFSDTSLSLVLSKMTSQENIFPRKGHFPETAQGLDRQFALVSLDADLYEPTIQGLRYFYPRMSSGGVILLHDYHNARFSGVRAATDAYEDESGRLLLLPVGDLHGSVMIIHP